MEQDAVKCPVLKWPTQAHSLEPQHEVPLSLSPGHCRAPGLLERHAGSTCQKSQQVGRQACPEGLGARNGGLLARGAGFRVLEGRLFSLLTNLTWEAEQRYFLFLKHRKGSFLGVCVCNHIHSCSTESGTCESVSHEAASIGTSRDPADTPYGKRGEEGMMELRKNRWSFFFVKFLLKLKFLIKKTIIFPS